MDSQSWLIGQHSDVARLRAILCEPARPARGEAALPEQNLLRSNLKVAAINISGNSPSLTAESDWADRFGHDSLQGGLLYSYDRHVDRMAPNMHRERNKTKETTKETLILEMTRYRVESLSPCTLAQRQQTLDTIEVVFLTRTTTSHESGHFCADLGSLVLVVLSLLACGKPRALASAG